MISQVVLSNYAHAGAKASSMRQTIKSGEAELREFYNKFPNLTTPSNLFYRMAHLPNKDNVKDLQLKIIDYIFNKHEIMKNSFKNISRINPEKYTKQASNILQQDKIANCGHLGLFFHYQELLNGENSELIQVKVKGRGFDHYKDHVFVLKNKSPKANARNPKSWGSKAVILDPLLKRVAPAHELIAEYEDLLRLKKNSGEFFSFRKYNVLPEAIYNIKKKIKTTCTTIFQSKKPALQLN